MKFYTVRDLRTTTKTLWDNLSTDGEVVITNNGKPTALLFDIADGDFCFSIFIMVKKWFSRKNNEYGFKWEFNTML